MILNQAHYGVRECFSNAAENYDQRTDLHQQIGETLIMKLKNSFAPGPVLDIGMGTGWFTSRLKDAFPTAMVVGMDFASGMVACARKRQGGFGIVQADARTLPFKQGVFSNIASNLALQWIRDLNATFTLCRSCLCEGGALCVSMFGRETLRELFAAISSCDDSVGENGEMFPRRLAKREDIAAALRCAGFHHMRITAQTRRVYFPDMMAIVKWVRDIGANRLPRNIYIGRDLLFNAARYYDACFRDCRGVYASFEIYFLEAQA